MRAILWARVSDPRRSETERRQDVENQLLPLRDAARRMGWEVVHEISVDGSAWNRDPPEKEQLRQLLEKGVADLVAVWDIDRWSRKKPVDVLNEITQLERHLGVRFYSLRQPFLSTLDDGLRQALIGLFSWMAEAESAKRSERVKASAATKRARAGSIGRNAKWGKGKIPTLEEEAEIRRLRKEDPQQWTYGELALRFDFAKSTVHRIIKGQSPPAGGSPNHP